MNICFDDWIDIIIHGEFEIDEYAIIFFVEICFIPTVGAIINDIIIGKVNIFIDVNCEIKIVGIIFCHVVKIIQFIQLIACMIDGIHKCVGIIPILINILTIIKILLLRGNSIIKFIIIDININDDDILWIIRYFIDWSVKFFLLVNKGKNEIKFNSIFIHENSILFDDIVIIVVNIIIELNIIIDKFILIKKRKFS